MTEAMTSGIWRIDLATFEASGLGEFDSDSTLMLIMAPAGKHVEAITKRMRDELIVREILPKINGKIEDVESAIQTESFSFFYRGTFMGSEVAGVIRGKLLGSQEQMPYTPSEFKIIYGGAIERVGRRIERANGAPMTDEERERAAREFLDALGVEYPKE